MRCVQTIENSKVQKFNHDSLETFSNIQFDIQFFLQKHDVNPAIAIAITVCNVYFKYVHGGAATTRLMLFTMKPPLIIYWMLAILMILMKSPPFTLLKLPLLFVLYYHLELTIFTPNYGFTKQIVYCCMHAMVEKTTAYHSTKGPHKTVSDAIWHFFFTYQFGSTAVHNTHHITTWTVGFTVFVSFALCFLHTRTCTCTKHTDTATRTLWILCGRPGSNQNSNDIEQPQQQQQTNTHHI